MIDNSINSYFEKIEKDGYNAIEMFIEFKHETFLHKLSDEEIINIIGQDDMYYSCYEEIKIMVERDENLTIKGYIMDPQYYTYQEHIDIFNNFKQHILNGITLYMMTKVVL